MSKHALRIREREFINMCAGSWHDLSLSLVWSYDISSICFLTIDSFFKSCKERKAGEKIPTRNYCLCRHSRPLHTYTFSFEKGDFFSDLAYTYPVKTVIGNASFQKTLSKVEVFENAVLLYSSWCMKTEVFENDYETMYNTSKCACSCQRLISYPDLTLFYTKKWDLVSLSLGRGRSGYEISQRQYRFHWTLLHFRVDADFVENSEKKSPYSNKDGYLGRGLRLKGPNFHKFKLNFTLTVTTSCH